MENNELNALLKLLSDPDEFVSESARKRLINEFEHIQDKFNEAIADSDNEFFIEKANDLYAEYNFSRTKKDLLKWLNSKERSFIKGYHIINRFFDTEIELQNIQNFIDKLKRKITFDVQNLSPIEQIRALNFIFFKEYKIRIIYNDEEIKNNLFSSVIHQKKASPFLISFLYFLLAKKLDIPLYLIQNKNIILLAYFQNAPDAYSQKYYLQRKINYSFFVNAPDRGYIYTNDEIKFIIDKYKIKSIDDFTIVTAAQLVKIMINKFILMSRRENRKEIYSYLIDLQRVLLQK